MGILDRRFLLIVMVILAASGINLAWATPPRAEAEANATLNGGTQIVNAGDMVGGSVTTGGYDSRAFAFAHGLGDVDINDCLASTQWGTIIVSRQKVVLNKWCAAEVYDAKGLYQMAAIMRCDIPEIALHFSGQERCLAANTVTPAVPPAPTVSSDSLLEVKEEHEYQLAQLQAKYEALQQAISETAERDRQGRIAYQRAQQERRAKFEQYAEQVEALNEQP